MDDHTAGDRLRAARRKAGLSADELGRRAALLLGRDKPISASAVRNQENGTNGIPIDTAQAYAHILGVTPGYIVWGDEPSPKKATEADPEMQVERELWDELAIPALRVISAAWLPMIMDTGVPSSQDHILVGLQGWNAAASNLQALQVFDKSLEPTFRRGSRLICAPIDETYAFNGSYVLASWFRGEEIVHSIRRVFGTDSAVHLAPAKDDSPESWICIQSIETVEGKETWVASEEYWIDGVVLASLHLETPTGKPLYILERSDSGPSSDLADDDSTSIGDLRRDLRDAAWPARNLDFVGIRLRDTPKKR